MFDEHAHLQARDRVRKRLVAQLTPEQRIDQLGALLDHYSQMLLKSPQAMDHFLRTNLKKRAVRRDPLGTP